MVLNLEVINRELVSQYDATPFRVVFGGTECESWVCGRDGKRRRISFNMTDLERRTPGQFVDFIINLLIEASQAGAPKPFCLHCGREY